MQHTGNFSLIHSIQNTHTERFFHLEIHWDSNSHTVPFFGWYILLVSILKYKITEKFSEEHSYSKPFQNKGQKNAEQWNTIVIHCPRKIMMDQYKNCMHSFDYNPWCKDESLNIRNRQVKIRNFKLRCCI